LVDDSDEACTYIKLLYGIFYSCLVAEWQRIKPTRFVMFGW